ncbi:MAG TPA: MFS transporter [Verrucomicrobiae bacterium]|nr:MFS transporter [Verrucomicrobiae bacterium]
MSTREAVAHQQRTILLVALGYWSAALTNGALRVVLPVYYAAAGVSISKIAFLFFLFKLAEIFAPLGIGLSLNRFGYKKTFLGGLAIHSAISFLYVLPGLLAVYVERFLRGMLYMADMSAVYVKHFSSPEKRRFHINMMLGLKEASKGGGMLIGGVLIAMLTLQNTLLLFALLTTVAAAVGLFYLPDLREQVKTPVLKIWGTVDNRIKTLGLGFGFLNGALDAWGVVVLPVYLTTVLGASPAFVGTVMMAQYIFHGFIVTVFSKYANASWDPRKLLILNAAMLIPVCLALSRSLTLYPFLALVFVYMFFFSACMVYYNHLMLEFASEEKTSIDLATYTTLTNLFKPVAVFLSGFLAQSIGFSSTYYFSIVLTILSALTCLALPRPAEQAAEKAGAFAGGSVSIK